MNVKEGQEVLVENGIHGYRLLKVKKITPKGFIRLSNGKLFDENGREKGKTSIWKPNDYIIDDEIKIRNYKQMMFIRDVKEKTQKKELSYEQAIQINEIIGG